MKRNSRKNSSAPPPASIDEQVLTSLKRNGTTSVERLYAALRAKNSSLTEPDLTDAVWRLAEAGKAEIEDAPPPTRSIREYLRLWERNLGAYLALTASLATVMVIYTVPPESSLVMFRWVLGSAFVLFIPGYVTVEALFPKARELDGIERFALSVGLSLALVPLIGLLLNYTPWGIRLDPIVASLSIFTAAVTAVGIVRRFRMSVEAFELQQLA